MALLGNYLTVRLQSHSSGTANEVIAETTSVDCQFNADALETTSQTDGLNAGFIVGKNTIQVSGNYLLASDGEQFDLLFVHANAGDKIEVELYRSGTQVFSTEGVFTSLSDAGGLSDSLVTGAYSMELDSTALSQYNSTYQTVYDAFATKPSGSIATAQNTMVASIVSSGAWAKLDTFYLFANSNSPAALINWVLPGTSDATLTNAPTFTSLEGYTGNGTSMSVNTNYNPSTDATNLAQNDASATWYVRTNVAETEFDWGALDATGRLMVRTTTADSDMNWYANQATNDTVANADSRGIYTMQRTGVSNAAVYKNTSSIDTGTETSVALPNGDILVLAHNSSGSPANWVTKQVSMFAMGSSLTTDEITALHNAVEVYMDSNGKGVIT